MQTHALPHFDDSVNTTGCCYRFNPDGWDGQELHLENKPFIAESSPSARLAGPPSRRVGQGKQCVAQSIWRHR